MPDKPLVVIAGPTASGKSALAMELAKKYNGEIICADSRTVYRGMDVGTAKPTKVDQKAVKHHLLDLVDPDEPFTAADFKRQAQMAIDDITSRGKLPIMVGGTGLYIDAVLFDYQFGPKADPKRRTALQELSVEELQQICQRANVPLPLNDKNKRHLIRAIELGGLIVQKKRLRPCTVVVAITTNRDELHLRIQRRAQEMAKSGVVEEARRLASKYGWEAEAMTGNIYRALHPVVTQAADLQEALKLFVTSDMRLAKRQITWLRRNPYIIWGEPAQLSVVVEHFVQQNKLAKSIPPTS
jgi:tRNA dimethylallyltransferase